ncbi:MAG: sigma-70 family RNA polymerase sigma factor [Bacteroidota bacterium]
MVQHTNTEQLFIRLYQTVFPAVARYVSRRGGSFDEAKDVFQDAVVIYYERSISAGDAPRDEKAYLTGIAKHLWLKSYEANNRYIPLDEAGNAAAISITDEQQPLSNKILHYLESTGQKCMDLLRSFYYDKLSMSEIAQSFGFSGERSATVQKFKCLEKVRETVKSKSLTYEDFVE